MTVRKPIKDASTGSTASWDQPVRKPQPTLAMLVGCIAILAMGLIFGLVSRYIILVGLVGGLGIGFLAGMLVIMPFKLLPKLGWAFLPLALLCGALAFLELVLTPFVWVTLEKDPSAGLATASRLAWTFYKAMLPQLSSSLLITVCTAVGAVVGLVVMGLVPLGKPSSSESQAR